MQPYSASPERIRVAGLNRVPEDSEPVFDDEYDREQWEAELEEEGFYVGSYPRLVALYTLAPLTFVLAFSLLAALPYIFFRPQTRPNPNPSLPPRYPYPPLLPSPIPELLAPIALYTLTHALRTPLYTLSAFLIPNSFALGATLLSTLLHTLLAIYARLAALSLLLIRQHAVYAHATWRDTAFSRVWWAGLGWAAAEAIIATAQGYAGLALYRDVLVPPRSFSKHHILDSSERTPLPPSSSSTSFSPPRDLLTETERTPLLPHPLTRADSADTEIERDLDQLLALRAREELEDALGLPPIHVPAFIPCLQRLNALLLSLGLFLLLGASLYSAGWALMSTAGAIHFLLASLHAPGVLSRVGLHTAAFAGAVVSLGVLFAGLGVWGGVS